MSGPHPPSVSPDGTSQAQRALSFRFLPRAPVSFTFPSPPRPVSIDNPSLDHTLPYFSVQMPPFMLGGSGLNSAPCPSLVEEGANAQADQRLALGLGGLAAQLRLTSMNQPQVGTNANVKLRHRQERVRAAPRDFDKLRASVRQAIHETGRKLAELSAVCGIGSLPTPERTQHVLRIYELLKQIDEQYMTCDFSDNVKIWVDLLTSQVMRMSVTNPLLQQVYYCQHLNCSLLAAVGELPVRAPMNETMALLAFRLEATMRSIALLKVTPEQRDFRLLVLASMSELRDMLQLFTPHLLAKHANSDLKAKIIESLNALIGHTELEIANQPPDSQPHLQVHLAELDRMRISVLCADSNHPPNRHCVVSMESGLAIAANAQQSVEQSRAIESSAAALLDEVPPQLRERVEELVIASKKMKCAAESLNSQIRVSASI